MKKCDFCTQSDSRGECCHTCQAPREQYCKEAIKKMVKALGKERGASDGKVY